jgi:hypothetical protein
MKRAEKEATNRRHCAKAAPGLAYLVETFGLTPVRQFRKPPQGGLKLITFLHATVLVSHISSP